MYQVIMPKLGMAQSYCVIDKWLKKEGDFVKKGEVVAEVSTDKVTYEIEAKAEGYLLKILRKENEEVPATETIAIIGDKGEEIIQEKEPEKRDLETTPEKKSSSEVRISALAKKIAMENNVDISKICGSGPQGRIMKEDIDNYLSLNTESGKEVDKSFITIPDGSGPRIFLKKPITGKRKIIAEKMSFAIKNIPHISQSAIADVSKLVLLKENRKSENLSYTDYLIKATAIALRENLEINSSLINDEYIIYDDINIGLVTSIPDGLIIPVLRNCDRKSVKEISQEKEILIKKAQENKLTREDISDGTFTISNLGLFRIKSFTAIIFPPQGAILTSGRITQSPMAVDKKIEIRDIWELTVAEDHRIIDGAAGAKFLTRIVELLESPELMGLI